VRSAALFPLLLVGACLGRRVHVDEWTDIAIEQKVDVWTQGQHWRLYGVTVMLDSITGIPTEVPLSCDSCRVGFPRSRIDSVVTRHTSELVKGVLMQAAAISYTRLSMYLVSLIP
jgi:hypothetical protein